MHKEVKEYAILNYIYHYNVKYYVFYPLLQIIKTQQSLIAEAIIGVQKLVN